MTAYVDPRLMEKIEKTGQAGPVELVMVVKNNGEGCPAWHDGGLARQVIEAAIQRTGETPGSVRYFPRANAAVLSASGRFIQELIKDEHLAVAGAADVDAIAFL